MANLARARHSSRLRDIAESQALLLELSTSEPMVIQCFKIIESTCLSQGLFCQVRGEDASKEFQLFLEEHYVPFCKAAIRAMFTYGFVPWRTRRLLSGDEVPEVLPAGTFSWHTEAGQSGATGWRGGPPARRSDDDSRLVVYRITPIAAGLREEDVRLSAATPPGLDVSVNSNMYATVPSPMAHLLVDYKNLREAQKRRSHADAWNTTARLVSTFRPNLRIEDNPTQYLMDFVHENHYAPPALGSGLFPPFEAHNVWQREHVIRRQFHETPSNHHPEVYALPRDHDLAPQARLDPCEDLDFLLDKYRRDVCALLGVPFEMAAGRAAGGHETVRKTIASGRIFSTNMHEICRSLQRLLREVYCDIYRAPPAAVEFVLVPMPRLEVETIADFKVLFEIGALTPDMTVHLSRILLGEHPAQSMERRGKRPRPSEGLAPGPVGGGVGGENPRPRPRETGREKSREGPRDKAGRQ
jgi:hypothetical protein